MGLGLDLSFSTKSSRGGFFLSLPFVRSGGSWMVEGVGWIDGVWDVSFSGFDTGWSSLTGRIISAGLD